MVNNFLFQVPQKFLIINHSNEKFVFKSFTEAKKLQHFLYNLDDLDFYEDISFSFEYFNDYDIKDISSLFNEQKIFSIKQILFMSIYAQTQVSYLIMFALIFLSGVYVLKYDSKQSFWFTINAIWASMVFHFIYFGINSYFFG